MKVNIKRQSQATMYIAAYKLPFKSHMHIHLCGCMCSCNKSPTMVRKTFYISRTWCCKW